MSTGRYWGVLAVLHDGRILLAGGENSAAAASSAEIFDPATGTWSNAHALNDPNRDLANAVTLSSGRVLVFGSLSSSDKTAEVYDSATNTWTNTATDMRDVRGGTPGTWSLVAPMPTGMLGAPRRGPPRSDTWAPPQFGGRGARRHRRARA
jgi:hypothetical protein